MGGLRFTRSDHISNILSKLHNFILHYERLKDERRPRLYSQDRNLLADFQWLIKWMIGVIKKPRVIRIGKTKIIIGLLTAFILWPNSSRVIYADPISPAPHIASVSLKETIPQSTLQSVSGVSSISAPVTPAVITPTSYGGDCGSWLSAAGIAETSSVDALIASESGCRPTALNPSGACGIGQMINGCDTYDPVQQLIEMNSYILSRYGSWDAAWAFHVTHNWY